VNGVVRHVQLLADVALGQVAVVAHEPPGDVQQGGVTATAALFWLPLPDRRARRRNRTPGRVAVRQVAQAAPAMAVRRCTSSVRVGALLRLPADWLSPGASPAQAASRAAVRGPGHVAAGLGDDHLGGALPDPGDGDQPGDPRTHRPCSAPVSRRAADWVTWCLTPVPPVRGGRRAVRSRGPGFSAEGRTGPPGRLRRAEAPWYRPPRSPPRHRRTPAPMDLRNRER